TAAGRATWWRCAATGATRRPPRSLGHRPQHDVADRGVARGHVVEAVQFLDPLAHRRAHYQPHDQLDPLGARLAQELEPGDLTQLVGALAELVEEGVVELGIDQPGALALELVAHAPGAPDLHVEPG